MNHEVDVSVATAYYSPGNVHLVDLGLLILSKALACPCHLNFCFQVSICLRHMHSAQNPYCPAIGTYQQQ